MEVTTERYGPRANARLIISAVAHTRARANVVAVLTSEILTQQSAGRNLKRETLWLSYRLP